MTRAVTLVRRLSLLAAALLLGACGGATPDTAAPATAATTPAAETPEPEPAPAAAPAAPTEAATTAAVTESAAPADTTGETIKLTSAAPDAARVWRFQEGQDYKLLTSAQGTTSSPDKIEVAEAFWYGCGHCYEFDPVINEYKAKLPADVAFVRVPVMWNPTNQIHARIYYTAQALGKLDQMHPEIFREIHISKKLLTDEDEIEAFFGRFGVSAADFQKTFRSFAVESQLKRARDLTERYQVRGVPLMIVNGKYNTDASGIKSYDNMLEIVSELVERERARL
jgi:thiol:disulfide interchange protein DsbA